MTREIYGMPAFVSFAVSDIEAARDWYTRGLDCELDALGGRARRHGGGQVEGPADTPWNTRDLRTRDPDGNVVVFTAPRPPEETDPAFSAGIRDLADRQLG